MNWTDGGHCKGCRDIKSPWVNCFGTRVGTLHIAGKVTATSSVSVHHLFPWYGPPQSLSHVSTGMSMHSLVLHGMNMVNLASRCQVALLTHPDRQSAGSMGLTGSLRDSTQGRTGQIFRGTTLYVITSRS